MPEEPDSLQFSVEELKEKVRQLEEQVGEIQERLGISKLVFAGAQQPEAAAVEEEEAGNLVGVAGISLLGLAAAFLLRALTEMQLLPTHLGIGIAVLYAAGWLVYASRASGDSRIALGMRGATSALILIPLLWEAQVRFHAVSSWITAGVLVAYGGLGLMLAWRRNLTVIAWITSLAGLLTACAMLVATKDLVPFTWVLLLLALSVEASACFQHWMHERWIVALVNDLAVLLLTFIVTRPEGIPEGYAPVGRAAALVAQGMLLAVYLASTIVRTLWRKFDITVFEIAQCVVAFLIFAGCSIRVAKGHPAAWMALGAFFVGCAAICYLVSFTHLERRAENDRNFYVYATFGLLLALTGTRFLAGGFMLTLIWAALAVAATAFGKQARRVSLKWHGVVYLAAAMTASGLLRDAGARYLGEAGHAGAGFPLQEALVVTAAAVAAYLLTLRAASAVPSTLLSMGAALSCASLLGWAITLLCRHATEGSAARDYCPTYLTSVLTVLALGLAITARRAHRPELRWPAFLLVGIATVKILVQDLQRAHALGIVLSLLIYGAMLVWLPRLTSSHPPPPRRG